ncbi:MAG TPA: methyltransferase domain-containing protein [Sphingomonadaceae bacterium]|nr:methyltransferase domain-containing protein [Sphingomonadaceae bacterium]
MTAPVLFDRKLRRLRRERSLPGRETPFLHEFAFAELLSRLDDVKRRFTRPLLIGCTGSDWLERLTEAAGPAIATDPAVTLAAVRGGVAADEDHLPFADASFDLVIAVGSLDSIDDLPGALLLIRRILRPDGMMLAALASAGSLPRLRSAMLAADAVTGGATPRLHPSLDVRTGGDLLARAGFALPVADTREVELSYAALPQLVSDLRAHGATNILDRRSRTPISKAAYAAASADFAKAGQGGRTLESVEILFLSGWRPVGAASTAVPS